MTGTTRKVTFQGNPLTLLGSPMIRGNKIPQVVLFSTELKPTTLAEFEGKPVVLCTVPSFDTSVCSTEMRNFQKKLDKLSKDIYLIAVSMDLPFAQDRWCSAENADNVIALSDHRTGDFGLQSGTMIEELRLLTRAVFILDSKGIVQSSFYIPEVTQEPDYDQVLEHLKEVSETN